MDYGLDARASRLAADYVLGTMRGAARRRMRTLLPAHPALRRWVAYWEDELAPLAATLPAVTPPAHVWVAIERRLFDPTTASSGIGAPTSARAASPWWRSLPLWQTWSAVATVGALSLLLVSSQPAPVGAPVIVVLQANPQPGGATPASFDASFVASVSADGRAIVLKPLNTPAALSAGRALELWAVPTQGAPRSLGLVRPDVATTIVRAQLLRDTSAFAVSVEPAGGSPSGSPTGPIISLGKLQL